MKKYIVTTTVNGEYDSGHIHESGACTMSSSNGLPIVINVSNVFYSYEDAEKFQKEELSREIRKLQDTLYPNTEWELNIFDFDTIVVELNTVDNSEYNADFIYDWLVIVDIIPFEE